MGTFLLIAFVVHSFNEVSRKCNALSLTDKLRILKGMDKDPKRKLLDLVKELGIPSSTCV